MTTSTILDSAGWARVARSRGMADRRTRRRAALAGGPSLVTVLAEGSVGDGLPCRIGVTIAGGDDDGRLLFVVGALELGIGQDAHLGDVETDDLILFAGADAALGHGVLDLEEREHQS